MSDVKRFILHCDGPGDEPTMMEDEQGQYMLYRDYTAILRRLEELEDENKRLRGAAQELLYAISQWRQGGMMMEGCQRAEQALEQALAPAAGEQKQD